MCQNDLITQWLIFSMLSCQKDAKLVIVLMQQILVKYNSLVPAVDNG